MGFKRYILVIFFLCSSLALVWGEGSASVRVEEVVYSPRFSKAWGRFQGRGKFSIRFELHYRPSGKKVEDFFQAARRRKALVVVDSPQTRGVFYSFQGVSVQQRGFPPPPPVYYVYRLRRYGNLYEFQVIFRAPFLPIPSRAPRLPAPVVPVKVPSYVRELRDSLLSRNVELFKRSVFYGDIERFLSFSKRLCHHHRVSLKGIWARIGRKDVKLAAVTSVGHSKVGGKESFVYRFPAKLGDELKLRFELGLGCLDIYVKKRKSSSCGLGKALQIQVSSGRKSRLGRFLSEGVYGLDWGKVESLRRKTFFIRLSGRVLMKGRIYHRFGREVERRLDTGKYKFSDLSPKAGIEDYMLALYRDLEAFYDPDVDRIRYHLPHPRYCTLSAGDYELLLQAPSSCQNLRSYAQRWWKGAKLNPYQPLYYVLQEAYFLDQFPRKLLESKLEAVERSWGKGGNFWTLREARFFYSLGLVYPKLPEDLRKKALKLADHFCRWVEDSEEPVLLIISKRMIRRKSRSLFPHTLAILGFLYFYRHTSENRFLGFAILQGVHLQTQHRLDPKRVYTSSALSHLAWSSYLLFRQTKLERFRRLYELFLGEILYRIRTQRSQLSSRDRLDFLRFFQDLKRFQRTVK